LNPPQRFHGVIVVLLPQKFGQRRRQGGLAAVPAHGPSQDAYRVRGSRAVTWDGVMDEIKEARCNSAL